MSQVVSNGLIKVSYLAASLNTHEVEAKRWIALGAMTETRIGFQSYVAEPDFQDGLPRVAALPPGMKRDQYWFDLRVLPDNPSQFRKAVWPAIEDQRLSEAEVIARLNSRRNLSLTVEIRVTDSVRTAIAERASTFSQISFSGDAPEEPYFVPETIREAFVADLLLRELTSLANSSLYRLYRSREEFEQIKDEAIANVRRVRFVIDQQVRNDGLRDASVRYELPLARLYSVAEVGGVFDQMV